MGNECIYDTWKSLISGFLGEKIGLTLFDPFLLY